MRFCDLTPHLLTIVGTITTTDISIDPFAWWASPHSPRKFTTSILSFVYSAQAILRVSTFRAQRNRQLNRGARSHATRGIHHGKNVEAVYRHPRGYPRAPASTAQERGTTCPAHWQSLKQLPLEIRRLPPFFTSRASAPAFLSDRSVFHHPQFYYHGRRGQAGRRLTLCERGHRGEASGLRL